MLEQSVRRLAEGDVTVTGIVTALSSWEYGSSCELVERPSNQLYYIQEGRRSYHPWAKGEPDFLTGPGDLILMPAGCSYNTRCISEEGSKGINVLFTLKDGEGREIFLEHCPRIVAVDDSGFYQDAMSRLHAANLQGGFSVLRAKELLYTLLYRMVTDQMMVQHNPTLRALLPAVRYMEEHLQQSLPVNQLAELCYMSRSTFFRRFQAQYGLSPTACHLQMRLQKSRELLESGLYTVERVSELMGFCDTAYFSRLFRKVMGVCAGDCRPRGPGALPDGKKGGDSWG